MTAARLYGVIDSILARKARDPGSIPHDTSILKLVNIFGTPNSIGVIRFVGWTLNGGEGI